MGMLNIDEHVEEHRLMGIRYPNKAVMVIADALQYALLAATPDCRMVTLLSAQADETYTVSSCTYSADTTDFVIGDRSAKMTMSGAATGQLRLDYSGGRSFGAAQAIGIAVYLPDASKVTAVEVDIYQDAGLSIQWSRSISTGLVNGWNYLRHLAAAGTITAWGTVHRVRVMVTTNAATTASVGYVWAEVRAKASLVFVEDGVYKNFLDNSYPDLKLRGIPIVMAPDTGILGTGSGINVRSTAQEIAAVAADGNGNEVSFHGYQGDPTSAMTATQLLTDTRQAQKWLLDNGYLFGALWRAAYVQNQATNAASTVNLTLAQATSTDTATTDAWPPINRNNIPRISLHGRSTAYIDALFTTLGSTRGNVVVYTHMVDSGGGTNMTPAEWAYFLGKVDSAIAAGWLECTTFERLFRKSGGIIKYFGGRLSAAWDLLDGTTKTVAIA